MKSLLIKTIVFMMLISGIGTSIVSANSNSTEVNDILIESDLDVEELTEQVSDEVVVELTELSQEALDFEEEDVVNEYEVDVEEELDIQNADNMEMIVKETDENLTNITSEYSDSKLAINTELIINEEDNTMVLKSLVDENGTNTEKQYSVQIDDIEGENFKASLVDLSNGEILEINTIDAQATIAPAVLLAIIGAQGLRWAVKKYGKKLIIKSFKYVAIKKASGKIASTTIKSKHLTSTGGRYNKFNTSSQSTVKSWLRTALKKSNLEVSLNDSDKLSFVIKAYMGKKVGTKGEKYIKIVIGIDGKIWTTYPVKS
jgi:hypothetical protein